MERDESSGLDGVCVASPRLAVTTVDQHAPEEILHKVRPDGPRRNPPHALEEAVRWRGEVPGVVHRLGLHDEAQRRDREAPAREGEESVANAFVELPVRVQPVRCNAVWPGIWRAIGMSHVSMTGRGQLATESTQKRSG